MARLANEVHEMLSEEQIQMFHEFSQIVQNTSSEGGDVHEQQNMDE